LTIAFGLAACKKNEPKLANAGAKQEPAWVSKCAAAFPDAGKGAFYGCGSMPVVENNELQKVSADSRARKDLAMKIDAYLVDFFKEFFDSAPVLDKSGGITELKEKEFISDITREVTIEALAQARVAERWKSPKDGTLYSLDKLGFDHVAAGMEKQMRLRSRELNLAPNEAVKMLDLGVVKKSWE